MRRLIQLLLLFALALAASLASAQGGPPFITDDPGTPGNKQWEINLGLTGDHNPGAASYRLPDVDVNYGWGDRIQLMYDLSLAAATGPSNTNNGSNTDNQSSTTQAGLGESQFGVKWRPYEHHRAGESRSDENMDFSLGFYPQASINNPTSAVRRGVVAPGPQYYLPVEFTTKLGPVNFNGELGRWIGNRNAPSRWGRGLIAGHEFSERLELYGEIFDLQDVNRIDGAPRQRELTLDLGGRHTLDRGGHLRLLFMGGRAIQAVTRQNSEPNWIAYVGVQILLGTKSASVSAEQ
jgi:hypothetical protein